MRSFSTLLTFLLAATTALTSQTLVAEFQPIAKKTAIDNLLLSHEKDGRTGICYVTARSLVVQVLGADGQSIYQKEVVDNGAMMTPQGVLVDSNAYHFVYFDDRSLDFNILTAGKQDAAATRLQTVNPFDDADWSFGNILSHNELYCLAWNKKSQQLKVGRYRMDEGRFEVRTIPMSKAMAERLRSEGFQVTDATVMEPQFALERVKLYLLDDGRIALTVDTKNYDACTTELLLVDWENSQAKWWLMGPPVMPDGLDIATNSFIHNDVLAIYEIVRNKFCLRFYGLKDVALIKEYKYTNDDTLNIMNSMLFVDEENNYSLTGADVIAHWAPTRKILNKLTKGKPFIFFEETADDDLVFTIGNYVEGTNAAPMGGMGFRVGGGLTMGFGFGGYGGSYQLSRYFYSIMDKSTLSHKKGKAIDKSFLTKDAKLFVEKYIDTNRGAGGLFSSEPVYYIANVPGADYALIVSYIKKDNIIKLHKISL